MKILATGNTAYYLANFQAGLLRSLVADGHHVTALVPWDEHLSRLEVIGCEVVPLSMNRRGTALYEEVPLIASIGRHFARLRPDIVLSYTIKNNLYGGLVARVLGIPFLPNVSGLGSVFARKGLVNRLIPVLYRRAFRGLPIVFFQNSEDRDFFCRLGIIGAGHGRLLPGSGVDTEAFTPRPLPGDERRVTFLLISRLLRSKGIGEFVAAAHKVAACVPQARFRIAGPFEDDPQEAISRSEMDAWMREGAVEYLGNVHDIRDAIAGSDCVVLPSYYHEGTPRALLEAAAMGRPIVTTNMPGCRSVVEDGIAGFLCKPRDVDDLADKIVRIATAAPEARAAMGAVGRRRAEQIFDERLVIAAYRQAIDELLDRPAARRRPRIVA